MHDEPFSYQRTEQLGIARRRRRGRKERKKIGERMVEEVVEGLEKSQRCRSKCSKSISHLPKSSFEPRVRVAGAKTEECFM